MFLNLIVSVTSIDKDNLLGATSLSSIFSQSDTPASIVNQSTSLQQRNITKFLESILPVVEKIVLLPDEELRPSPITNTLFTSLVGQICDDTFKEDEILKILSNPDILRYQLPLMQQCSSAEYYLEAAFAREIKSGAKSVEDFLYYDNYVSLVQFEMDHLKMYAKNASINRVVVIGAGPLPLTSVEVLKHLSPSAVVTNYDQSEEAVELAKIVVNKDERNLVEHRTALKLTADDMRDVDLVYLAALVGNDMQEKKVIVEHLYDIMKSGAILAARSAIGLKTLVYRRLTTEEFGTFSNIQEFHPTDKRVLNSIMCGTRQQ